MNDQVVGILLVFGLVAWLLFVLPMGLLWLAHVLERIGKH